MTSNKKTEDLAERFRLNVLDYEGCSINSHISKQCALIAEEFSIGFAEWLRENYYDNGELWTEWNSDDNTHSSKELLEIYKKEQKL